MINRTDQYEAACVSYHKAAELAAIAEEKNKYLEIVAQLKVMIEIAARFNRAGYEEPYTRINRLRRQGHYFPPASAARCHTWVSCTVMNTWAVSFFTFCHSPLACLSKP